MTRTIDFYFDFISPFSYLAQLKLPDLAHRTGCTIEYWPIDIPEAKIAAGNYGPSNREVAPKIAVKHAAPLKFPASFACADWNCAVLYARSQGYVEAFVTAAYHRIWGLGIDPRDLSELRSCADEVGLDADGLCEFIASPTGQSEYRKVRTQAYQRGVFGAPMMFVDEQIFWGNDRLDFLESYLLVNQ